MSETVRVEFDPPRQFEEAGKTWKLSAEGEATVYFAKIHTQLELDGDTVRAVTIPRYIAEDRGLVGVDCLQEDDSYQKEQTHDNMSRSDWFTLGMAMALVIRGEVSDQSVVHDAWRLAERLLRK